MSIPEKPDGNHCFVCSPTNPDGLKVSFRLEDESCVGQFTPGRNHVGWENHTHGGIIYSLLDDVMANWLYLRGEFGVTARCEIRYRQPLYVGQSVTLRSDVTQRRRRAVILTSTATRDEDKQIIADCQATFFLQSTS